MKPQTLCREVISNPSKSFQCLNSEMMNKSCALTTTARVNSKDTITTSIPLCHYHISQHDFQNAKKNFEEAMQHSSNCQITGKVKTIGYCTPSRSPKSHLSTKNSLYQGSLHGDLQQSGTFRRSHQPTLKVKFFGRKWLKKGTIHGNTW